MDPKCEQLSMKITNNEVPQCSTDSRRVQFTCEIQHVKLSMSFRQNQIYQMDLRILTGACVWNSIQSNLHVLSNKILCRMKYFNSQLETYLLTNWTPPSFNCKYIFDSKLQPVLHMTLRVPQTINAYHDGTSVTDIHIVTIGVTKMDAVSIFQTTIFLYHSDLVSPSSLKMKWHNCST